MGSKDIKTARNLGEKLKEAIQTHPHIANALQNRKRCARIELDGYKIEYVDWESFSDPGMAHTRIDWHRSYRAYVKTWLRWKKVWGYTSGLRTMDGNIIECGQTPISWNPNNNWHINKIVELLDVKH